MTENEVSLQEVLTMYVTVWTEARGYWYGSGILEMAAHTKLRSCFFLIDGYDLCDLFYPRSLTRDQHYEAINKLWWEFFALCKKETMPFNISAAIAPGSAYEIIALAQGKVQQDILAFKAAETGEKMSLDDFRRDLNRAWASYLNLQPFLTGQVAKRFGRLIELYNTGRFTEFSQVLKLTTLPEDFNLRESSREWPEFDYDKGMKAFNARRPGLDLSNMVDTYHLMTGIAVMRNFSSEDRIYVVSHSGHTLGAWSESWLSKPDDSPVRSSLAANIFVTSIVKHDGDLVKARNFAIEGSNVCQNVINELERIPEVGQFKEANRETRERMRAESRKVAIPQRALAAISYWKQRFARDLRWRRNGIQQPVDYGLAAQLVADGEYRRQLTESANLKAKQVFAELLKKGILNVNTAFIPEDPACVEILNWLQER